MNKKKLLRLIALSMACLSMGVFAFSGCRKKQASTGGNEQIEIPSDDPPLSGNPDTPNPDNPDPDNPNPDNPNPDTPDPDNPNPDNPGGDDDKKDEPAKEPEISGPVAGGVKELKASNEELEAAYVTWKAADNAKWYNVYYSEKGANSWTKLDGPLVREYKDYYRADAVGLKAGEYDMKVVPVSSDDEEAAEYASTASGITVKAQTREGYAFTGGNVPGAYNTDGTLKANAQVIYVTAATAKTVTATVNGAQVTGFQSILDARKQSSEPLCFRIVGTVNRSDLDHISSSEEGLQVKGAGTAAQNKTTSNITIEGVGNDGTINDFGILIRNCKNVEVKNLGIVNFIDDGVSVDTGNSNLWIHNLDIFYGSAGGDADQAKGDGSLDSKASDYCTYSYNHFWDSGKCNLLGNGDSESSGEGGSTHITYHHNWYDHSDSRHPRIRIATVHIYNNYFDGNSKYGVGAANDSTAFVESNYFRSTAKMKPILSANQGTDATSTNEKGETKGNFGSENGGAVKAFGNVFDCPADKLLYYYQTKTELNDGGKGKGVDCWQAATRDEIVPDTYKTVKGGNTYNNFDTASDFYKYNPDTAEQAKRNVERYAGRMDGGDLKYDFDDATQDSNYAIIPELKSAVTNYKGSVIKIGGAAVDSGSTEGGSTGGNTGNEGGETGGETPVTPPVTVDGEIVYIPQTDGTTKSGITITSGSIKSGKATATIDGVTYSKSLELDSKVSITFTAPADKDVVIKVYLSVASLKYNGNVVDSANYETYTGYSVCTINVAKGTAVTLSKKDTSQLFKLVITPAA